MELGAWCLGLGFALGLGLVLGVIRYVLWNIRNAVISCVLMTFCDVLWFMC